MNIAHCDVAVSPWVVRWAGLIPKPGNVLDVACGAGRHARWLLAAGYRVTAVDRDLGAVADLAATPGITLREADLEVAPWPFSAREFEAVVVTNYLHRPLFASLLDVLKPGGLLIYETFAVGNERLGKPSNPAFLLRPGELLQAVAGKMRVVAYEDVYVDLPKPAMVQRICARIEA